MDAQGGPGNEDIEHVEVQVNLDDVPQELSNIANLNDPHPSSDSSIGQGGNSLAPVNENVEGTKDCVPWEELSDIAKLPSIGSAVPVAEPPSLLDDVPEQLHLYEALEDPHLLLPEPVRFPENRLDAIISLELQKHDSAALDGPDPLQDIPHQNVPVEAEDLHVVLPEPGPEPLQLNQHDPVEEVHAPNNQQFQINGINIPLPKCRCSGQDVSCYLWPTRVRSQCCHKSMRINRFRNLLLEHHADNLGNVFDLTTHWSSVGRPRGA